MHRVKCNVRVSSTKLAGLAVAFIAFASLFYHLTFDTKPEGTTEKITAFPWMEFETLGGYWNGVRMLVPYDEYQASNRYNKSLTSPVSTAEHTPRITPVPPLDPVLYNPYPAYQSPEYLQDHQEVKQCYLDPAETVLPAEAYVYPGLPQYLPRPFFGSHTELGLREDVCFDRFGRLCPYSYGPDSSISWDGPGRGTGRLGSEQEVCQQASYVNYTEVDWAMAQNRCFEKNRARFEKEANNDRQAVKRNAFILRTWTGYKYSEYQIASLRAMITELALKSGGEYDVHFLVHVKDNSIPIWADETIYNETVQKNVPREFWNISTLWSESLMKMYYPGPFRENFANFLESNIHKAYRSPHFALQWFSQQHPEYDFYWNWEMDVRYTGHYYEFCDKVGEWAKKQPRKGLWERSRRFWIPALHGDYQQFSNSVAEETIAVDLPKNDVEQSGPVPIWGPLQDFNSSEDLTPPTTYALDDYQWGVGEDGDLLVFNPIFDPSTTNWVFRADVTGYDRSLPIPPRRASIITAARLSKRLLNVMHEEVWRHKHNMFAEMWAPTVCLHHGLKAVYVPHPVYLNKDWNLEYMDQVFNYPKAAHLSPFGWGENNLFGSTFYYDSSFAANLWRRWLGQREKGEGGRLYEEAGSGRMCLRGTLLHPVKHEDSPVG